MTMYSDSEIARVLKEGIEYRKLSGFKDYTPVPYPEKTPKNRWWWLGFLAADSAIDDKQLDRLDASELARKIRTQRL